MCTNLLLWAPAGAHFCCWLLLSGGSSLGLDSGVAAHSCMAGSAWNCMTWDQILRVIPVGSRNPWQTVDVLDDVLQHRAELYKSIGFGDGRATALRSAAVNVCPLRSLTIAGVPLFSIYE